MDKKLLTKNCVLSLGCGHSVGPRNLIRQSHEKVCVWCVFDSLRGLDRTLCLQPMAGHSIWQDLDIKMTVEYAAVILHC